MCLKASSHVCAKYSLISRSDCAGSRFPITLQHAHKGTGDGTKTNEFSEKFQTAFDRPSFSENHVALQTTAQYECALQQLRLNLRVPEKRTGS